MTVACSTVRFTHAHTWAPILARDFPSGKSGKVHPVKVSDGEVTGDIQDYEDRTKVRIKVGVLLSIACHVLTVQTGIGALSVCVSVGMFGFVCTFSVVDCSLVCQMDSQSICLIILCVVCVVVCLCLFVSVCVYQNS